MRTQSVYDCMLSSPPSKSIGKQLRGRGACIFRERGGEGSEDSKSSPSPSGEAVESQNAKLEGPSLVAIINNWLKNAVHPSSSSDVKASG